jgi:hypothetical protein
MRFRNRHLVKMALPGLKVLLAGREYSRAVSVEPCGGAPLGVLLVDWLSVVVQFKDVSPGVAVMM